MQVLLNHQEPLTVDSNAFNEWHIYSRRRSMYGLRQEQRSQCVHRRSSYQLITMDTSDHVHAGLEIADMSQSDNRDELIFLVHSLENRGINSTNSKVIEGGAGRQGDSASLFDMSSMSYNVPY